MISIPTAFKATGILVLVASLRSPVAIIEDITGTPPAIHFMDYLKAGDVIQLGPQDSIVLGYLKSCWRETITGGTVTVGAEQSKVQNGKVERSQVACGGGKMELTAELAGKSGTMVFRDLPGSGQPGIVPAPQFTLYGRSPVIEVRPRGTLIIERIDAPGERHEVPLNGEHLVHGTFLDLATTDVVLAAGGVYRAKAGAQEIVFKIDPKAHPGQTPIVGRLLRLQPAN